MVAAALRLLLLPPPLLADTTSFIQLQFYVNFHSAPDELLRCFICCLSVSTTAQNSISLSSVGKASKLVRHGTSSSHSSVNSSASCDILSVPWVERRKGGNGVGEVGVGFQTWESSLTAVCQYFLLGRCLWFLITDNHSLGCYSSLLSIFFCKMLGKPIPISKLPLPFWTNTRSAKPKLAF